VTRHGRCISGGGERPAFSQAASVEVQ